MNIRYACAELGSRDVQRSLVDQLYLLAEHLSQPQQRCHDCIQKHFLTVEAILEELNRANAIEQKRTDVGQRMLDAITKCERQYIELHKTRRREVSFSGIARHIWNLVTDIKECTRASRVPRCRMLFKSKVKRGLAPILSPDFNVRQACKELIWLQILIDMMIREKNMRTKEKVIKGLLRHLSLLHGFVDEAFSLENEEGHPPVLNPDELKDMYASVKKIRSMTTACVAMARGKKRPNIEKARALLQLIRAKRKILQKCVFSSVRTNRFKHAEGKQSCAS